MKKRIHIRQLDDWHIPLWIIKDASWMLGIKPLGVAMIVPTVAVAVWLCVKTYPYKTRFFAYLAVLCWILANSTWMLCEFFGWDALIVALFLFIVGLCSFILTVFDNVIKKAS